MMWDDYWKQHVFSKYHVTNIHYVIWKRIFLSDPELYKIIEGVIFYHNSWEMEILTVSPEYGKLWECLHKDYDDSMVKLVEMEYDKNMHCNIVCIHSPDLMDFIRSVQRMWSENPRMKKEWIEKYGSEKENNEFQSSIYEYRKPVKGLWF